MDLARIDGVIPYISQQQLELFLGSADIFETNILLKINSLRISKIKEKLHLTRNDRIFEEKGEKIMKENEQQKKEKEIGINVMDSDRKAVNSIAAPRKSICAGILTKLNKPFQNEEPSGITREQHQCYNGHDEDHNQKHHQQIYDFTGSLKDELSVPAFGTGTNETVLQAVNFEKSREEKIAILMILAKMLLLIAS
uniref:Uncharacterized protein n=1 Tax=Loa loa TaxID=7209 RepID=A0A1I7W139_LOALO